MSIIGDPFKPYVQNQIKIRQKSLGAYTLIPIETQQAYLTKTPWIRLASSVQVTEGNPSLPGTSVLEILTAQGNFDVSSIKDDLLSQNFILYGGVTNNTYSKGLLYGLTDKDPLNGAYGFGGTSERGYVPPPGIIGAELSYKNDGALAQASINIKAFNRTQFQLIDILFQRPGYSLLLEFGHTTYLDNNNKLVNPDFHTTPFNKFFIDGTNSFDMASAITAEKDKWNGNYEAMFGRITKFNWKFNPDGSYDITVNLVGNGDVINALKMNLTPDKDIKIEGVTTTDELQEKRDEGAYIVADANLSIINQKLYEIYKSAGGKGAASQTGTGYSQSTAAGYAKAYGYNNIINPTQGKDYAIDDFHIFLRDDKSVLNEPISSVVGNILIPNAIFKISAENNTSNEYEPNVLITFGTLLALISSTVTLKSKKGNIPLYFYDFNFQDLNNDTNYIVTFPGNFSSNPGICLVPYDPISKDITLSDIKIDIQSEINTELKNSAPFRIDNEPYIGRLANIYVDINFITETFSGLKDKDGNIILIDFLKNILDAINRTLGGLNEFRVIFNESINMIQIVSETPMLSQTPQTPEFSIINVFGVAKDEGSFVRNMDLNSELSDAFATQISIGAQADGNQPNENATSFSIYNKGLIDRIIPDKTFQVSEEGGNVEVWQQTMGKPQTDNQNTPGGVPYGKTEDRIYPTPDGKAPVVQTLHSSANDVISKMFSEDIVTCFNKIYVNKEFIDKNIATLENFNLNFAKKAMGILTQNNVYPAPFFLPFNLSLTMDGLSGMKIYESFKVSSNVLPLSYNTDNLRLIIKSLSHSVNQSSWTTKVETLAQSIFKIKPGQPYSSIAPPPSSNSNQGNTSDSNESCGEKSLYLNNAISSYSIENNAIRKVAIFTTHKQIFARDGEVKSMCGLYAWNMANSYVNYLRGGKSLKPSETGGGRNANSQKLSMDLMGLGYKKVLVGKNLSKAEVISSIKQITFTYGDILIYFCHDAVGTNQNLYGHVQTYVGEVSTSKWASSKKDNYGAQSGFVYGSKAGSCWDLIIYRTPTK